MTLADLLARIRKWPAIAKSAKELGVEEAAAA